MLIKSALESFAKYFTMAHFSIHVFFYAGVQVTRQKKVVTTTTMIYGLNFVLDGDMHVDMVVMNEITLSTL